MACNFGNIKIDKTLFIVTGISGSGKTTLAKQIQKQINGKLISVDKYKKQAYEEYGFYNDYERVNLENIAKSTFKAKVIKHMRSNKDIVVEYPFNIHWQKFFHTVAKNYNYTIIIVNCNTRDFEDIWEKRLNRDRNFKERPKCLVAKTYIKDKLFENSKELNNRNKHIQEKMYKNNKYTSLTGDYIFNDKEILNMI